MDVILNAIDEGLKRKGLTDAAASKLAVGHPSLIKNFRAKTDGDKRYNVTALQKLSTVLDLEFYFGPPREAVSEDQRIGSDFAMIPRYDARLAAGAGSLNTEQLPISSMAFRLDWLSRKGINPKHCCVLTVSKDSMEPTLHDGDLVMIDQNAKSVRDLKLYAFVDANGEARVKRFQKLDDQLILISDNKDHPAEIRSADDANQMTIIGQVVWSGHDFER